MFDTFTRSSDTSPNIKPLFDSKNIKCNYGMNTITVLLVCQWKYLYDESGWLNADAWSWNKFNWIDLMYDRNSDVMKDK